jgi:hypothetical protein
VSQETVHSFHNVFLPSTTFYWHQTHHVRMNKLNW